MWILREVTIVVLIGIDTCRFLRNPQLLEIMNMTIVVLFMVKEFIWLRVRSNDYYFYSITQSSVIFLEYDKCGGALHMGKDSIIIPSFFQ